MLIKTNTFLDCMASGVIWSIPISRWANWHDMAHQPLEDAEMSVTCTRYLNGDPPPWDGANLRHGALVIDIIDKSGVYVGTSHGGTIFDGLARPPSNSAKTSSTPPKSSSPTPACPPSTTKGKPNSP